MTMMTAAMFASRLKYLRGLICLRGLQQNSWVYKWLLHVGVNNKDAISAKRSLALFGGGV